MMRSRMLAVASRMTLRCMGLGTSTRVSTGPARHPPLASVSTAALLACGILVLSASAPAAASTTGAFSYTGADQSFVVPAGVNSLTVKLWAAAAPTQMREEEGGRSGIRRATTELATAAGGGGGGGSSFIASMTGSTGIAGGLGATIGVAPGGAADPDYAAGVGVGGATSAAGGPGRIVLIYELAPEIAVEQPVGNDLLDGTASVGFGSVPVGGTSNLTFTIKNTGDANLTGLAITTNGTDAAMFSVIALPTAPLPGPNGSTTFTVQFAPTSAGGKTAAIQIANNDLDENPFDITLTGTGAGTSPTGTIFMFR